MKFTVQSKALKEAIRGLSHVADKLHQNVRIGTLETGVSVNVVTMNDAAEFVFPEAMGTPGAAAYIDLSDLKDFLKVVMGDMVELEVDGSNGVMRYVDSLWKAEFMFKPKDGSYPELTWPETVVKCEDFGKNFKFALPFACKDDARLVLNGVHFDKNTAVVATDGRRIVAKNGGWPLDIAETVPKTKWLSSVCPEKTDWVATDASGKKLLLGAGSWRYSLPFVESKYPNWKQVVPDTMSVRSKTVTFGKEAIKAVELCSAIVKKGKNPTLFVRVLRRDGGIELSTRSNELDRYVKINVDGTCEANIEKVCLNPEYLAKALKCGFMKHYVNDEFDPLVSVNDEGWTHVLMPVRDIGM